jgi:hypothetical protein
MNLSLMAARAISRRPRQFDRTARAERREVLGSFIPVARLEDIMQGNIWAWKDSERRSTKRKKDELDLMRIAEASPKLP